MNKLTIIQRHQQDVTILDLVGNVKMGEDVVNLRQALRILITEGEKKILLNLAGISLIDSSGLGELVAGYISLQKIGGELKLLNLTTRVSELMMITKLLTVFDSFEDEGEAINSFQISPKNNDSKQSDIETAKLEATAVGL
ncbi:MAG: STAS domain-containing protein [Acidobacteriota bacterium]